MSGDLTQFAFETGVGTTGLFLWSNELVPQRVAILLLLLAGVPLLCSVKLGFTTSLILKAPCAPKQLSSSFSYSKYTNDFGAVTYNERRFQFRPGQLRAPSSSGFHG